jgi:hypothetical protein
MVGVEDTEGALECDLAGAAAMFPPNSLIGRGLDLGPSFILSSFGVAGKLNRVRRKLEGRELKINDKCREIHLSYIKSS